MATPALTERYAPNLHGVLSCFERIIAKGTSPGACQAGGMPSFLYSRGIRSFDDPKFLLDCTPRYPAFLSSLEDPSAGGCDPQRLIQPER